MPIHAELIGDLRIAERFQKLDTEIRDAARPGVIALTSEIRSAVEAAAPHKTGALAAEITSDVKDFPERIIGRVFVDAPDANTAKKAAALEYGSRGGSISVRVGRRQGGALSTLMKKYNGIAQLEQTYNRTPDVVAQEYLRRSVAGMQDKIVNTLRDAIDRATTKVKGE